MKHMINRRSFLTVTVGAAAHALSHQNDDERRPLENNARIKVERADGRLDVLARGPDQRQWIELASFVMKENARPYLHPVRDGGGNVVLTEDKPADHPWQHGIFTG